MFQRSITARMRLSFSSLKKVPTRCAIVAVNRHACIISHRYYMQCRVMQCNATPRYAMLRQQRSREQFSNSQVATRSYNSSMESLLT